MQWITDEALHHGLINPEEMKVFTVTNDVQVIFEKVKQECDAHKER
jgi:hypothetical protein